MVKIKKMLMLDRYLLKKFLYNNFVLPQTTEQNDMIHAIEVDIIYKYFLQQKNNFTKQIPLYTQRSIYL